MVLKRFLKLVICVLALSSCSTIYYETWDKLGKQKRDLLKDRIEDAKDEQKDLQGELKDALTQIKEIYGMKSSELERAYRKMQDSYDDAKDDADALQKRIARVETVGNDLFEEWSNEIKSYKNETYRADSKTKLKQSRERFDKMLKTMRQAEKRVEPVMTRLHDQVIYLKHNLNAQALGSLKKEMVSIEKDIHTLIADMEKSIKAGDEFIQQLN